jgi:uncharacterized protein (TIGR03083 family)
MRDERRELRALLLQLTPEQWAAGTLCDGWDVRDLAAHLLAWDDLLLYRTRVEHFRALARFTRMYLASVGRLGAMNGRIAAATGHLGREQILDRFGVDDPADLKWLFDRSNPGAHLAEYVIHHQDIRRPQGLEREIPPDRLLAALHGMSHLPGIRLRAWWRMARRRWEATDVAWGRGRGPVVARPGELLLMCLAGRPVGEDPRQ